MVTSPMRFDLRSLAALRIALGGTLLIDLAIRASDLTAHYGVDGVYKCRTWETVTPSTWHLFPCNNAFPWVEAHFVVHAIVATMLLFGVYTRFATLASWVLLVSLQNRNPLVLNGADVLLRMLLLWSIFLPLSAHWSVDARRGRQLFWGKTVHSPATWALAIQVLVVYPVVLWERRNDVHWHGGTALEHIMAYDLYATRLGLLLRDQLAFLRVSTHGTMYWELIGPALALIPVFGKGWFRTFVVFGFLALHIGIGLTVNVGMFPFVSCAGWLAFLPTGFWDTLLKHRPSTERPTIVKEPRFTKEWVVQHVGGIVLVYALLWSAHNHNMPYVKSILPNKLATAGSAMRIEQRWRLFSSIPRNDGWFMVVGDLADGTQVDLMRDGKAPVWKKPSYVLGEIPSRRWGKLLMQLREKKYESHRWRFLAHYARIWNQREPCSRQIKRVELIFMPEKAKGPEDKKVLWYYTKQWRKPNCDAKLAGT